MPLLTGILDIHSVAGYGGIKSSDCQTKGCCYIPAPATTGAALVTLPACFYPNGGDSSFSLSGALQSSGKSRAPGPYHIVYIPLPMTSLLDTTAARKSTACLAPCPAGTSILHQRCKYAGCILFQCAEAHARADCAVTGSVQTGSLSSAASTLPQFGPDVSPLNVDIQYITSSILRVKVGAQGRWEVPATLFNVTPPTGAPAHCCQCLKSFTDPQQEPTSPPSATHCGVQLASWLMIHG